MVATYFLPIDPDQKETKKHSPHYLHYQVSYILITTCHCHIIRKSLLLVDENTVTTIAKLLFWVSKTSRRSSVENPTNFTKSHPRESLKGFEKQMHHLHECSHYNRPQGDAVLQRGRQWTVLDRPFNPLRSIQTRKQEAESTQLEEKAVVASSLMCFLNFNLVVSKWKWQQGTKKRKRKIPVTDRSNPGSYDSGPKGSEGPRSSHDTGESVCVKFVQVQQKTAVYRWFTGLISLCYET